MKAHWRTILFLLILLLTVVPIFSTEIWGQLGVALRWPALFVLQLCLVTSPWRTVPLRLVWAAFMLGAGPVMAVTLLVQAPVAAWLEGAYTVNYFVGGLLGESVDVAAVLLAPLSEEVFKILPLVLILLVGPWRHLRYTASPLDWAAVGAALGAGFETTETIWQGIYSVDLYSYARLAEHISPHLGPFYLLPTLTRPEWSAFAWFGHAGVTAALALALELALRLAPRRRVWWLLPVGVGGLVILEHLLTNLGEPSVFWLQALALLDLRGLLSALLFVAGTVWAAVMSGKILARYRGADPSAAFGLAEAARAALARPAELAPILLLLRLTRAAAYGLDWLGHTRTPPQRVAFMLVGMRELASALRQTLP
jgi:RsiW-degrading membrane proteinase PrsW (M82 family)